MNTFQFRLVLDEQLPMFKRLEWDLVEVSFRDVIERGIHPWAGDSHHLDLADAFADRMNQEAISPLG